jgi:transcriptional regulator with XRE-family HTH domain
MAKKKIKVNEHVGQHMRARRIALGLSQDDVGRQIGVAAQQVQKYEKGTNAMNAQRLYKFARLLKVPVAHFFEGLKGAPKDSLSVWAAGGKNASDRESLEILKSFKRIKDYGVRKRIADLLRSLSLKDI